MFLLQTDYKSEPHNTMCANISKDCIQHSTIPTASKARIIIWSISNNKNKQWHISNRAQSLYWHLQISASCLPPVCVSKVANKTNASGGETNLYLWFTWSSALVNTTTTRGKVKDECGWPLRGDGHLLTCGRDLKHARCIRWTQLFHLAS